MEIQIQHLNIRKNTTISKIMLIHQTYFYLQDTLEKDHLDRNMSGE